MQKVHHAHQSDNIWPAWSHQNGSSLACVSHIAQHSLFVLKYSAIETKYCIRCLSNGTEINQFLGHFIAINRFKIYIVIKEIRVIILREEANYMN